VTVIGVPYHLDEYLPDLDLTPEPAELITPKLPAGEIWSRLAALYTAVARAVTRGRADGGRPVVVASGDCLTALGTVAGLQAAGADPAVVWFDAAQLPSLRYPTPGGPDAGQLADALSLLFGTGRVAAVGIACSWFPGHGAARLITPYLEIALANA
jgi:arginase family enzyme